MAWDNSSVISDPSATTTATNLSGVGQYPIELSGGSASNYDLLLNNGTLEITPKALTATADNITRVYKTANPTLTISYSGFENGDNPGSIVQPSASTTATTTSNIGV